MMFKLLLIIWNSVALITGNTSYNRIIGGDTVTSLEDAPYQVSIRSNWSHICGGAIIHSNIILTAAHCMTYRSINDLQIVIGSNSLFEGGHAYEIKSIVVHKEYNRENSFINDIAIIKLKTEIIDFAKRVISVSSDAAPDGSEAVFTGWGQLVYPSNSLSTYLQKTIFHIINTAQCQSYHFQQIYAANHLCAFNQYGIGACGGDSGGPLVITDESNNKKLIGIASWVRPCGVGFPDVYVNVCNYVTWINEAIKFDS